MVKVVFALERDEHGWPPTSAESLWADDLGDGRYRLDNVPWFAHGVSDGDVVEAEERDGQLWFTRVVEHSGRSTFRVAVVEEDDVQHVRREFRDRGIGSELDGELSLIALDVPPGFDLAALQEVLEQGKADGRWDWEEGNVPAGA